MLVNRLSSLEMGSNTAYETSVTNSVTSIGRQESDREGLCSAVSRERKVTKDYVGMNKIDSQTITTQIHSLSTSTIKAHLP
jgi:hypothetical protein